MAILLPFLPCCLPVYKADREHPFACRLNAVQNSKHRLELKEVIHLFVFLFTITFKMILFFSLLNGME